MNKQQTFRIRYENLRLPKLSPYCDITCMVINQTGFARCLATISGWKLTSNQKHLAPSKAVL